MRERGEGGGVGGVIPEDVSCDVIQESYDENEGGCVCVCVCVCVCACVRARAYLCCSVCVGGGGVGFLRAFV
jgi:hypothetical protein